MFSVICRTGGTADFKWAYVAERYATRSEAEECALRTRLMGYSALVFITRYIRAIGLPDTFSMSSR